jgi:hypothetical protein
VQQLEREVAKLQAELEAEESKSKKRIAKADEKE